MPDVDFWDDPPEQRAHPPPSDGAPRVVLAPVDDSDHAARAVAWACQHLLRGGPDGDTLHLLHVVPAVHASTAMAYGGPMVMLEDLSIFAQSIYAPYHASMATPGPTFWQQIEADERRRHATDRANARAFIAKRFEPILQKAGVKFVIDVTRGDTNNWSVGEIVCNHAKMLKATAVVMAPHGKGRMKEFFVGSVCNHCLHRCEAPLVMVRPERVDADGVKKKTSDTAVISTAEGTTQTVDGTVGGKVTNGDGREAVGVSA